MTIGIVIVLTIVLGSIFYIQYKGNEMQIFSFQESEETISNPARGFYMQVTYREAERLASVKESGHSLVLATMHLWDCIDTVIEEKELQRLDVFLQEARRQELMVIFRASYLWDQPGEEPELSLVETHIKQLSEVLNKNKDVVFVVQTGLVGLWGEWHGSVYLKDEQTARAQAISIVKWWQRELDETITLNLRRTYYITMAAEEGCDLKRLGMHNDALLATDTDLGTYTDREAELAWCEAHLNGKGNGGEMPYISEYTEIPNVLREFDQLSITYLNAYYNTEVLQDWAEQTVEEENALSYIEKKLGYRYYVEQLKVNRKLYPYTKKLNIQMELGNSGFSSVLDRFHLYLVIKNGEELEYIRLENESTQKEKEIYSYSTALEEDREIEIGFCYMDIDVDRCEVLPENAHTIAFANKEFVYRDGVNYFIQYELEEDSEDIYVPRRIKDK